MSSRTNTPSPNFLLSQPEPVSSPAPIRANSIAALSDYNDNDEKNDDEYPRHDTAAGFRFRSLPLPSPSPSPSFLDSRLCAWEQNMSMRMIWLCDRQDRLEELQKDSDARQQLFEDRMDLISERQDVDSSRIADFSQALLLGGGVHETVISNLAHPSSNIDSRHHQDRRSLGNCGVGGDCCSHLAPDAGPNITANMDFAALVARPGIASAGVKRRADDDDEGTCAAAQSSKRRRKTAIPESNGAGLYAPGSSGYFSPRPASPNAGSGKSPKTCLDDRNNKEDEEDKPKPPKIRNTMAKMASTAMKTTKKGAATKKPTRASVKKTDQPARSVSTKYGLRNLAKMEEEAKKKKEEESREVGEKQTKEADQKKDGAKKTTAAEEKKKEAAVAKRKAIMAAAKSCE